LVFELSHNGMAQKQRLLHHTSSLRRAVSVSLQLRKHADQHDPIRTRRDRIKV
jgi:hypothetical protein